MRTVNFRKNRSQRFCESAHFRSCETSLFTKKLRTCAVKVNLSQLLGFRSQNKSKLSGARKGLGGISCAGMGRKLMVLGLHSWLWCLGFKWADLYSGVEVHVRGDIEFLCEG